MKDEIFCTIREVSALVGVSSGTIRNWEKNDLFHAHRDENNYRIYILQDIEYLKKLKEYSIDQRLSIPAIKKLIEMDLDLIYSGFHSEDNPETNDIRQDNRPLKRELFQKWKAIREKRGLTLEDVSKASGVSISYLSRIENMNANVSLEIMNTLSNYYGETLTYFYETKAFSEKNVVRSKERCEIESGLDGIHIESLINRNSTVMRPTIFTVQPNCGQTHFHSHRGEEFIFVLEGEILIILEDGVENYLKKNDSISFPSMTEHKWKNVSEKKCRMLWVHSPISAN